MFEIDGVAFALAEPLAFPPKRSVVRSAVPRPWTLIDSVATDEGALELRQRGERDFLITVGGRVLMTSMITRSELTLAERGCSVVANLPAPRVLIGGLGLGFTLQAALAALPKAAQVTVAELNSRVIDWCRGPARTAANGAAHDTRVQFIVGDVTEEIARAAERESGRYDAILWDLYVGPSDGPRAANDPLYGTRSLRRTYAALRPGGVFGVWGEGRSSSFEARLRHVGFVQELIRTKGGGLHHVVFLGHRPRATL